MCHVMVNNLLKVVNAGLPDGKQYILNILLIVVQPSLIKGETQEDYGKEPTLSPVRSGGCKKAEG